MIIHVAISRPRRHRGRLDWELHHCPCQVCGAAVSAATPLIRAGDVFHYGSITTQGPDEIVGVRLEPCAHEADHFICVQQGAEHALAAEAVRLAKQEGRS